jgi:hypothetical protein
MQLFALALLFAHHSFSSQALLNLTISLPALAAGSALGVIMFRRVNGRLVPQHCSRGSAVRRDTSRLVGDRNPRLRRRRIEGNIPPP